MHILSSSNSLKYHRLHPEYIHTRIEKLGLSYNLRILLILCDIVRNHSYLFRLSNSSYSRNIKSLYVNLPRLKPTFIMLNPLTTSQACLINNITIIVAFSLVPVLPIYCPRVEQETSTDSTRLATISRLTSNSNLNPPISSKNALKRTTIQCCAQH